MNVALILAGGHGSRTAQDIPKQFMNVYEKPLIVYTLENFEKHPDIDEIAVVCIDGWHEVLRAYARQYGITKLKWIVSGGGDGQESTRNGIEALREVCGEKDVILVHDAVRPFLPAEVITDAIAKCRQKGSGLSAVRCQETIVRTEDGISGQGRRGGSSGSPVLCQSACQCRRGGSLPLLISLLILSNARLFLSGVSFFFSLDSKTFKENSIKNATFVAFFIEETYRTSNQN